MAPSEASLANLRPAEPGNERALKHGARSERHVKRVATIQKRRLLRQIGLRASDLDGLGLAFLDQWARAAAKVEIMDAWWSDPAHGFLDHAGQPHSAARTYFAALNSSRLALTKLEEHLRRRQKLPSAVARLQAVTRQSAA